MTQHNNRTVSDDMLMALADGELTGPDADKLRARIRTDPALAARYALFTRTAGALRQAMDPGPVPAHLIAAVLTSPAADQPASAQAATPMRPRKASPAGRMIWPLALAASLVLAVGVGSYLAQRGTLPAGSSPAMAATALATTATGGSVTLADGSTARALGSFDTELGLCRLIALQQGAGASDRAIVCRQTQGQDWQTALVVTQGDGAAFSLASDRAVATIDSFLDTIGAGAPLSPAEEARALSP